MNKMSYYDIVKSSNGNEAMMWDAVKRIDEFVSKVAKENPDMAKKFLNDEYVAMNGKYFNEAAARATVSEMWHKDKNGDIVKGEAVTPEDAITLIADMPADKQAKHKWDAYVAANASMHDLASTSFDRDMKMEAAKATWFHDDDMEGRNKVFWYFFK